MKKILLNLLFILLLSHNSLADQWDNLTKEQADNVVAYLQKYPFIFDYCDCCSQGSNVAMIRVVSTEIVPCEWDEQYYSVQMKGEIIARFGTDNAGIHTDKAVGAEEDEQPDYDENGYISGLITMNYTWGFHPENKNVTPLFSYIDYNIYGDDRKPCLTVIDLPSPQTVGNKLYKKWYKKNV